MKIRKKVQGASDLANVEPIENVQPKSCPYTDAVNYIKLAIDSLAPSAGDTVAKECIANLSVVLLDLKCYGD